MRKWYPILMLLLPLLCACVGQKDDPEPETLPEPEVIPTPGQEEGTRPYRRILALEFTASWCQYCPNMAATLEEASKARPGRIVDIAVHQYDEISPAEADAIVTLFKASGFPVLLFDWDIDTKFGEPSLSRITDYVDAAIEEEACCGLSLDSRYAGGQLETVVKVKGAQTNGYTVCAALVQDRLLVNQVGYGPGYSSMSVLRRFLGNGLEGETLTGESVSFSAEIDLGEAPESDFRIVAFVLKEGRVANATTGPLNGIIPFTYEQENL